MEYEIHKSDELAHWGIKGMRWGVRRYQNKDGSLTPAGEKRRAKLEGKLNDLGGSSKKSTASSAEAKPNKKKSTSEMDDNELARAINRARMEDEYRRLRPEPVKKPSFIKQLANDALKPAMINSGKKLAETAMSNLISNLTKGKADPNSLEALKKTYDTLKYKTDIDKMLHPEKYLSEEDKNKRQTREFDAENRAAQREGYQSVYEKAKADKAAAEKSVKDAKAAKDARVAAARAAQDRAGSDGAHSRFVNNTTDPFESRKSTWQNRANNVNNNVDWDYKPKNTHDNDARSDDSRGGSSRELGLSVVNNASNNRANSTTTRSNESRGKSAIDYVLEDSGGNPIRYYTSDDDVYDRR